ncbi:bifunctional metallophosphatase/5'-nucleotidase [bacterium]|nr:bifunctional metallophosphatase/5'-nucleotidase [bacterium]
MSNFKNWLGSIALSSLFLFCISSADLVNAEVPSEAKERHLTILHVNDVHGTVEPALAPNISTNSQVGGISYLASLIKKVRKDNPYPTILLNGGDLAEGSMFAYLTRGVSYCKALGSLRFDGVALGNHDFAWGQEALDKMIEALDSPVLLSNVQHLSDGMTYKNTEPYRIIDVDGLKVGILGLDTPDIRHFIAEFKLEDLEFRQSADTVRYYLPLMRKAGADLIVVLSHIGYEEDIKLAQEVPGIDLIVGGHSHTPIPNGKIVNNTMIVQAGFKTQYLGKVDITLNLSDVWNITDVKAQLIPVICSELTPDPEVEAILKPYREEAEKIGSEICGQASEDVLYAHREAAKLNQIHADSILQAAKENRPTLPGFDLPGEEKPLFGICNSRSLRGNISKGPILYKELYSSLPFTEENYVTMKVKGQAVIDEIEDDLCDKATELAVPCGLIYKYSSKRPERSRLLEVKLLDGTPLDPEKEYVIVSNETMSRKPAFKDAKDKRVLGPVQPLYFEAIKKLSPLRNTPDQRVVRVD